MIDLLPDLQAKFREDSFMGDILTQLKSRYTQKELATGFNVTQGAVSQMLKRWAKGQPVAEHSQALQKLIYEAWCRRWDCVEPVYLCSFSKEYPARLPENAYRALRTTLGTLRTRSSASPQFDLYVRAAPLSGTQVSCFMNCTGRPLRPLRIGIVLVNELLPQGEQQRLSWNEVFQNVAPLDGRKNQVTSFIQEYRSAEYASSQPATVTQRRIGTGASTRPPAALIDQVIRMICREFSQEECAAAFGVSQPTISRCFREWRSGDLAKARRPTDSEILALRQLQYSAWCRAMGCQGIVPVSCGPINGAGEFSNSARQCLGDLLFSTGFTRRSNIDADVHIRCAHLARGARAHCFGNRASDASVFIVLVSETLRGHDRYETAWDEVNAHIAKHRNYRSVTAAPTLR